MNTLIVQLKNPSDRIVIHFKIKGQWQIFYKRKISEYKKHFELNVPYLPNPEDIYFYPEVENVEVLPIVTKFKEVIAYPPFEQEGTILPTKVIYSNSKEYEYTPACTYPKLGIIIVNTYFTTLPKYKQLFILLHELAHVGYKTEHFCDMFAAIEMLKKGYNYTQVIQAMTEVLKDTEIARQRVGYVFTKFKQLHDNLEKK